MRKFIATVACAALLGSLLGCRNSNATPAGSLESLSVTPGPLLPNFTTDGHDYGVICASGKNTWTINAKAMGDGSTVSVAGAGPDNKIDVKEHQVVKIDVQKSDSTTDSYYVRCLPQDFPRLQVRRTGSGPPAGWYTLSPGVNDPNKGFYAVILDDHGAAVWYQKLPWPATNVKKLPDGNMFWIPMLGGSGYGTEAEGYARESDLNGKEIKAWRPVGSPPDFHDANPLPNGNMLLSTFHLRENVDISALAPAFTGRWNVLDAWIQEIRPDGSVAWQWHSEDHIGIAETVSHKNNGPGITPFNTIDLVHANSLELDPNGDLIVSSRHTDAVYKIRRKPGAADDGKIIWKLGGVEPAEKGAVHLKLLDDPYNGPARQHWARLLPNGHLTMFDNQSLHGTNSARAIEYQLDEQAGTAKLVWEYKHPGLAQSGWFGTAQRTPDNTTLIGWGGMTPVFSEVTDKGDRLLDVAQTGDFWTYSVIKEPPGAFDRQKLRDSAGPH